MLLLLILYIVEFVIVLCWPIGIWNGPEILVHLMWLLISFFAILQCQLSSWIYPTGHILEIFSFTFFAISITLYQMKELFPLGCGSERDTFYIGLSFLLLEHVSG